MNKNSTLIIIIAILIIAAITNPRAGETRTAGIGIFGNVFLNPGEGTLH